MLLSLLLLLPALSFGPKNFIIISDPGYTRQILQTNADKYSKGILRCAAAAVASMLQENQHSSCLAAGHASVETMQHHGCSGVQTVPRVLAVVELCVLWLVEALYVLGRIQAENNAGCRCVCCSEILEFVMGQGLIPADGEVWKVRRRAIVPALHKKYVASMVSGTGSSRQQVSWQQQQQARVMCWWTSSGI
jgi:hypothetical protein